MTIRILSSADAAALERFLVQRRDSSMFLRSNTRTGGLDYRGEKFQGVYAAKDDATGIIGVASHSWLGSLLLQAPEDVEDIATFCVAASGRAVTGFAGPVDQVERARRALGLEGAPAMLDEKEGLFALDLQDLAVPDLLGAGEVECRQANAGADREVLCEWRVQYDVEALGAADTPEQRWRAADLLDAQIASGTAWVALHRGELVALSAFNSSLPDMVQLGGIYTPPALRGRGYAKAAIAAQLLDARERGATRCVLFTKNPSAVRCYEALGFRRVGEYGLVLLRR